MEREVRRDAGRGTGRRECVDRGEAQAEARASAEASERATRYRDGRRRDGL